MSTNTKPRRHPFLNRVTSEARAAKTYVASAWGAHHLDQERVTMEKILAPIETEIGVKAEMGNIAAGLPAMDAVRAARALMQPAEQAVNEQKAAVAAAEERLQAAAQANGKAMETLRAEHERRVAEVDATRVPLEAARGEVATLERAARKAEGRLDVPAAPIGEASPEVAAAATRSDEAREELANLAEAKGPAEARRTAAREVYEAACFAASVKAAEVDRTEQSWKREEAELMAAVVGAERDLDDAVEALAERQAALDEAHRELGQAICEAGIRADPLTESLEKAAPLLKRSHEAATVAAELRVRAAHTRRPAMHMVVAAGVAMVVVTALAVTLILRLWQ